MPTDDDVTGLYASDSGDERRNGGLPEKLGSGIVWNEFHMPTEHKNRISERARFLSHRPQGNGKLRGSGDYGMPNSVPNTIDPPYHPKRSRTQSCYIAGSESPHGKPRGAASSARPSAPDRTADCKADPPCDRPRANPDISATSVQQPLLPCVNMAGSKDGTALRSTTERRRARWHSSWLPPRWSCSF